MSNSVDSLTEILASKTPWVALTGAGVSEASGIPTYRDHSGNWLGSQPIQHDEFVTDETKRKRYWSRSVLGWPRVAAAQPNATHNTLAGLEQAGVLAGVITQNVDRLHQRAGSQRVIDLHGRLDQVRCLECAAVETRHSIQQWLETHNEIPQLEALTVRPDGDADLPDQFVSNFQSPDCQDCGGALMPEVVFFGGTVPSSTVEACYELIDASAGMIVLGSSLSVYSGLRFCRYTVSQSKPLVVLNQGQTRADDICQYKFDEAPFELLAQCTQRLRRTQQEPING